MKNAKHIYSLLLKLYPHSYREEFGAEMMQTFSDHYQDLESGGRGSLFWLSTLTDETKNILRQHRTAFLEGRPFLKVTGSKLAASALLCLLLYPAFYAALVKVSLALPHPHLRGPGVIVALAVLFLLPGGLSAAAGYVIAGAFSHAFLKRGVRRA